LDGGAGFAPSRSKKGICNEELTPEERRCIYEEEKLRIEAGHSLHKLTTQRVVISVFCTLAVIGVVGGLGYRQYRMHELRQKLGEAIGRDQGLTETILRVESESSKITFGDV
jgi:hypothetical protein